MKGRPVFEEAGQVLTVPGVVLQFFDVEYGRRIGFENPPTVLMNTVDGDALGIFEPATERKYRAEPCFPGPRVRIVTVSDLVDEQVNLSLVFLRAVLPTLLWFLTDHQRIRLPPSSYSRLPGRAR